MSRIEPFLWGVFPYILLTWFAVSLVWRYVRRPFGWTSKSSEFLEKRMLKWGSVAFHYGILAVFCGHAAGLLVPADVYRSLGIRDETYHLVAVAGGLPAGLIALAGAAILLVRRIAVPRIRAASSAGDWVAMTALLLVIVTGLAATAANAANPAHFDYRTTIGPWLRGLLTFRPRPELMANVPVGFKIHILMSFLLYAVFPFTRLVHVFSVPLGYLKRRYVLYRRRTS